jgi:hypothetical protein
LEFDAPPELVQFLFGSKSLSDVEFAVERLPGLIGLNIAGNCRK